MNRVLLLLVLVSIGTIGCTTQTHDSPTLKEATYNIDAILGPRASYNIVKSNISGLTDIMSNSSGWRETPAAPQHRLRQLQQHVDGQTENGELDQITIMGQGESRGMSYQYTAASGEQIVLVYLTSNDAAGDAKLRELLAYFQVEP